MVSLDIIIPSIVGLGLGIAIAVLFTKYADVTNSYNATIFGINSNSLVTGMVLFIIIGGIVSLIGLSAIIRDTDYIVKNPFKFIIETILMGLLPSLAVMYVMWARTKKITQSNNIELLVLAAKFAALHILLQLSGYYRYVFSS
jgi:hypothetical protein